MQTYSSPHQYSMTRNTSTIKVSEYLQKTLKVHIMEPIRKEQTLNQNHIPIQPSDLIPNNYLSFRRIIHSLTPQL
jgi:hypothetical protein